MKGFAQDLLGEDLNPGLSEAKAWVGKSKLKG